MRTRKTVRLSLYERSLEDELQVDVFDMGNGMVQVEVKERPRPTVWKILAVTEESVNSDVDETEYNGNDPIKLNEEVIRFKEKLKQQHWKVRLKENGEEDIHYKSEKMQVILKVVRIECKPEEEKPKEKPRIFYILLDHASKDFPLFKNKNKTNVVEDDSAGGDSVEYDGRLHCLTWKGLSSERPDPSKLRLKEYGKYRYEFDNSSELQWSETPSGTRFKVNKHTKEEPKTFYIPLDIPFDRDGLPKYPLFKNYVTPEEAQQAISRLKEMAEGLKENDVARQYAKGVVDCLSGVGGEVSIQTAEENANGIPGDIPSKKKLLICAKEAIDKKKKSFVVEGDDSVRYDSDNHCLTWQGLPSERPDPTKLKLKKYEKHHYEFEEPPHWQETSDGNQRYKVNKITNKKDIYWLLEWLRTHLLIVGIIAFVVGLIILYVSVDWGKIKESVPKENPIKHISILPSCSREKSPDQPQQNGEEGMIQQIETDENTEKSSQGFGEESQNAEEVQGDQNTEDNDSIIIEVALNEDTKNWNTYTDKRECVYNIDFYYLNKMKTYITDVVDNSKIEVVSSALIKSGHIVEAVKKMDSLYSVNIRNIDSYFSINSAFAFFYKYLDEQTRMMYTKHSSSSGTSSTSRASSSSSGTSSTPGASSHSTVTPDQSGQNEQENKSKDMGSGTEGSFNVGTNMNEHEEKIIVTNIDELWQACKSLEVVMDYKNRINFSNENTKETLIKTIDDLRNAIKSLDETNSLDDTSYQTYYDAISNNKITKEKFNQLINKITDSNNQ